MLNLALMREPVNWVIVTLMVTLASLAVEFICRSVPTDPTA